MKSLTRQRSKSADAKGRTVRPGFKFRAPTLPHRVIGPNSELNRMRRPILWLWTQTARNLGIFDRCALPTDQDMPFVIGALPRAYDVRVRQHPVVCEVARDSAPHWSRGTVRLRSLAA